LRWCAPTSERRRRRTSEQVLVRFRVFLIPWG
jgi:hypothetical protein